MEAPALTGKLSSKFGGTGPHRAILGAAAAGGTLNPSMVPLNVIVAALAVVAELVPSKAINNKPKIIPRLA